METAPQPCLGAPQPGAEQPVLLRLQPWTWEGGELRCLCRSAGEQGSGVWVHPSSRSCGVSSALRRGRVPSSFGCARTAAVSEPRVTSCQPLGSSSKRQRSICSSNYGVKDGKMYNFGRAT